MKMATSLPLTTYASCAMCTTTQGDLKWNFQKMNRHSPIATGVAALALAWDEEAAVLDLAFGKIVNEISPVADANLKQKNVDENENETRGKNLSPWQDNHEPWPIVCQWWPLYDTWGSHTEQYTCWKWRAEWAPSADRPSGQRMHKYMHYVYHARGVGMRVLKGRSFHNILCRMTWFLQSAAQIVSMRFFALSLSKSKLWSATAVCVGREREHYSSRFDDSCTARALDTTLKRRTRRTRHNRH